MNDQEIKRASHMSQEDRLVVDKMNEIAWNKVLSLTPEWSQDYLNRFKAMLISPTIVTDQYALELHLAAHVADLQREGFIPDFFSLRNEARVMLELQPIIVEI